MTDHTTNNSYSRRQFIAKTTKAGLSIAALSTTGYLLHDQQGPIPDTSSSITTLPDFRVAALPGKNMAIINGNDNVEMLNLAIQLLGGIQHFIKPGDVVGIKPNVAFASPPILGATTSAKLVAEVARLCYQEAGAKQVIVFDNPINDPASCFNLSGIQSACEAAGAMIVMPRKELFARITLPEAKLIRNWPVFLDPINRIDKLIGIAPVKHHHRSGASMTMKNWYGLLGGRRNIFHQDIHTIIAELAMMVQPTFVILDGTQVMITNGPTGGSMSDLARRNTLVVGCDQVSVDSFGCSLLGLQPNDLPFLEKAHGLGAGTIDYQSYHPISEQTG